MSAELRRPTGAGLAALGASALLGMGCGGGASLGEPAGIPMDGAQHAMVPLPSLIDSANASVRAQAESVSVDLRTIPEVDVTPATRFDATLPRATGLGVDTTGGSTRRFSLAPKEHTLGVLRHADLMGSELTIDCQDAPTSIEWDVLTVLPDGRARYAVSIGVVDAQCQVFQARSVAVDLEPVIAGAGYLLRRCEGFCPSGSPLTVLTVALTDVHADELGARLPMKSGALTSVELPVRRGSAASLDAAVDFAALQALRGGPANAPPSVVRRIGIDVSQSASELAPSIVAFVTDERAPERAEPPPRDSPQIDF